MSLACADETVLAERNVLQQFCWPDVLAAALCAGDRSAAAVVDLQVRQL